MKKGIYKHFKGNLYEVIGTAIHSESRENFVLYKALRSLPELKDENGEEPFFVRPYEMFNEDVERDQKVFPRFKYIGNENYKNI